MEITYVYDEVTQQAIDFYKKRIDDIYENVDNELSTAVGQNKYIRLHSMYPNYHPIYDNQEYQLCCKALEKIYNLAVPKIIVRW